MNTSESTGTTQVVEVLENYFVLSLVLSFTIMVILWSKNPPFIQEENEPPELVGEADPYKLLISGIAAFVFLSMGPFVSDFIFSPWLLSRLL